MDAVLGRESFRGYHTTPATQRQVEAMSPEDYALWLAESHGASYLLCTYRVMVAQQAFRFEVAHDTTFDALPASTCDAASADVAQRVREVTRECTDLHRGAFYGADLIPLPE